MTRPVGLLFLALAMACSDSIGPIGPSELSFEGKSTVSPAPPISIQTVVTVRNVGDKTTRINTNICGQPLKAFTTPERDGTPVWQSYDPSLVLCSAIATMATLAPGDYYDFVANGTVPASLPSGVYYLAININGKLVAAGQFSK